MKHWAAAAILAGTGLMGLGLARAAENGGIDAIQAYAGTWKTEMEHFDTAFSKAGRESSTLRNECWKNGGFFVCNQYVNGESKALIVFIYDDKDKTYTTYPIPVGGGSAGNGKLIIDGNVWTYPWENTAEGKTTYFRVVNVFAASGKIEFRQEFSTDKVKWTLMAKGTEVKE